ncbi:MAG: 16S rRNA (cytidine(1402)-2'-O)-methyltransferase [Clostridiaceae bacterium]|nr:16S rRNA (cytidine(1402)-2'-O)-methyltransferase [Clostridiaceae bacterium]
MSGTLYIVSTPIGNLGDITARALDTLRACDFVAAEDTRVAMRLLSHFGISKPLVSYYEHNRRERGEEVVRRILSGEDCALTTDAGTPVVSDPGGMLVAQCREAGIPVFTIPGPCALVSAFSLAGLESTRFTFEGFLSVNRKNRREHLDSLRAERRPMIFYEAPHKLLATLEDFAEVFGPERGLLIARELTKTHEESFRTTLADALACYRETPPRGEFVLVVDGAPDAPSADAADAFAAALEAAREKVAEGASVRDAARYAAEAYGVARNAVYEALRR